MVFRRRHAASVVGDVLVKRSLLAVLAGLAGLAGAAHAVPSSTANAARLGSTIVPNGQIQPEFSSGSVTFLEGNGNQTRIGHNWDAQPSRNTVSREGWKVQAGGNLIEWERRSNVPPSSIGKGLAKVLATLPVAGTAVGVGALVWDMWDALRVQPGGDGQTIVHDEGVEQQLVAAITKVNTVCYQSAVPALPVTASGQTAAETCGKYAQNMTAQCFEQVPFAGATYTTTTVYTFTHTGTAGRCYGTLQKTFSNSGSVLNANWDGAVVNGGSALQCPASIDPLDPALSIPAGEPPDADGKCRRARYHWAPVTPEFAAERLEEFDPPEFSDLPGWADEILARDIPIEDVTPLDGVGPSSVPGQPVTTTTTNPDGTTTTTTETPTTEYTYEGDTITYITVNNIHTVITNTETGDVISETTTEQEGEKPETVDVCKENPGSLMCAQLGTPGSEKPTWQTIDVPFQAEDLGFAGSCPADNTWQVFGMSLTWGYQPVCDVAPMIRLALVLMASIGAIGIIFKETQS